MSPRSWLWWGVAVVLTHAHMVFAVPSGGIGCAGIGLYQVVAAELRSIAEWVPLVWYSGIPAVGLVVVTCWLWEPWIARQIVRWLAALLLLFFGLEQFGFLVDLFLSPGCLDMWGWSAFTRLDLLPPLAALCMIAAVRAPGRRLLNARRVTGLAVVVTLALVPAADLGSGPITTDCEGAGETGERALVCKARRGGQYQGVPDHVVLAHARTACAAYSGELPDAVFVAPLCPRAAADLRRAEEEQEREFERWEADSLRACDRGRHRPKIKPVVAGRQRILSEAGLAVFEDSEEDGLAFDVAGDYPVCVTAEAYRQAPPRESRGWERVEEVAYLSPTGAIVVHDPLAGPSGLPNLAIAGPGRYRVRTHYRIAHDDGVGHLLVIVFPERR
ncbi:hypothetical protein ACIBKY_43020 [Nonomuraea sp. NPDC050394]|uniref:hypothetical protein n=1 Tax=Nonomuraea sp. NPDC050394 TaxID=3364363 RepID=UPI0037AFA4FC